MDANIDCARSAGSARATGKWNRDCVSIASSLLVPLDVLSLVVAGIACTSLYAALLAPTEIDLGVWSGHEKMALAAMSMLGALCLYDSNFGTRASRGELGALIRRYASGFAIFASAALVIGFASDSFAARSERWVSMFFGVSFALTSLSRILLAWKIRRLEMLARRKIENAYSV